MTFAQGIVVFLFFVSVTCLLLWVITGYNPFKKKPSPFPPPRYKIVVDGYGKYKIRYNPDPEWEPSGYIELAGTFDTIEDAEKRVEWHKEWIIKREFRVIKEID